MGITRRLKTEPQQPKSVPPTVEEYRHALAQMAGLLTPNQKALLRAHTRTRSHGDHRTNRPKRLGHLAVRELGFNTGEWPLVCEDTRVAGEDWTESVISTWIRSGDVAEWVYVMRPELVAALRLPKVDTIARQGARPMAKVKGRTVNSAASN